MGDVAKVVGGGTPKTKVHEYWDGGDIPWITPADLSGYDQKFIRHGARSITRKGLAESSARLMPAGTVLFSSRAPIGYAAIAANPVSTNQGFRSFVLDRDMLPEYAFHYLLGNKNLAVDLAGGTTFKEISGSKAKLIPIPVPPVEEQRAIVTKLESLLTRLDAAVAALKRVRANLKRYRASVLKAACEGRLVPTEAELARAEGREYEPASVLLERILEERRCKWEEAELAKMRAKGKEPKDDRWKGKYKEPAVPDTDELPNLPDGWVWATVEQLSHKVVDGVHKKPNYVASGVPFVTVRNLTASPGISFQRLNYITPADHQLYVRRADPEKGDLLISKDGTLGVVRLIRTDTVFSIFVSVALVKPVDREMCEYLEAALSSPQVQRQMVPKGSGLQHIHLEDLRADCLPIPPVSECVRIVGALDEKLSVINALSTNLDQLVLRASSLRQAILRAAFAGKFSRAAAGCGSA